MSFALVNDLTSKRFLQQTATRLLAWIGLIASAGQIADWIFELATHGWWAGLLFALCVLGLPLAIWWSWPRPIEETYETPNTTIRIVKGDLFAQQDHLVIGTCDTFDTATPHIIARGSLQGIALERLYNNDAAKLDADLAAALAGIEPALRGPTRKAFIASTRAIDPPPVPTSKMSIIGIWIGRSLP